MNAGHKAVFEYFRFIEEGHDREEALCRVLNAYSITIDEYLSAEDELLSGDVESAALEVAALELTLSMQRDGDVYHENVAATMSEHCPLLRLYHESPSDFPFCLELKVAEMMNVIFDGAERIGAAIPATV